MPPPVDLPHTATFLPSVADTLDLLHDWGGVYLLVLAAAMALAALYELWPLLRLRLAARNRLEPGRRLVEGTIEAGAPPSPVVVEIDQEYRRHFRIPNRWVERARRIELAPFTLRLDDGRRVRVVPTEQQVTLLWVAVEREARTMMIRASVFYATLMLALIAACLVTQRSQGLRELRELAAHGQVVDAKVTDMRVSPLPVTIRAVLPSGQIVESSVDRSAAGVVHVGSTIPWTYLPADPSVNSPGTFERGQPLVLLLVIGVWVAWLAAMWIYWRSYRPWYRRIWVNQATL